MTLYDGTTVIGSGVASASGSWSIKSTTILPNGVQSITATATDVAGNIGPASTVLPVTIDTVPPTPAPSQPQLDPASDSGLGNNITNTTTPIFDGTANANTLVTLFDGATVIGTGTSAADGTWKITSTALPAGAQRITAEISDAAGNYSKASGQLTVSILDSGAIPSTPLLTAATDTGASKADGITNITLPAFTGTAPLSNTVTVYLNGTTVIGTVKANATTGKWTVTETTPLVDGTYSITATATTPAGVVSAPSVPMTLVIDTKAPAVPPAPALLAGSDSGVKGDNITNNTTPTFTGAGAEAGSTVTLFNGTANIGTAVAAADGSWSIASKTALANGVAQHHHHRHRCGRQRERRVGGLVAHHRHDRRPRVRRFPILSATSDSGVSSTDNITKVTTPTFTGTAEALSTVTVYDGTTVLGTGGDSHGDVVPHAPTAGRRNPQHHRQGGGCGGQHQCRLERAGGDHRHNGARCPGLQRRQCNDAARNRRSRRHRDHTQRGDRGRHGDGGFGRKLELELHRGPYPAHVRGVADRQGGQYRTHTVGSALIGTSGNNTLTSTAGNDVLIGAGGTDKFLFSAAFGQDIITDFAATGAAHDIINFHGSAGAEQLRECAGRYHADCHGCRDQRRHQHTDAEQRHQDRPYGG